ncbi:hypothetical protein [Robiginitalea sp. IMCC43444]|uniref:hypothetical protein n=1 Tax=Robiginitalea sp. IMCC43444 TaxID=3459121 RepID=UPI004042AB95
MTNTIDSEDFQPGRNRFITLTVDAVAQFGQPLDLNNFIISDGTKVASGSAIEHFLTQVTKSKQVIWNGFLDSNSRKEGYQIMIEQIQRKDGFNIFDTEILPGNSGMVIAQVMKDTPIEQDNYKYTISIVITNKDGDTCSYDIDPRLKGNPSAAYEEILIDFISSLGLDNVLETNLLTVIKKHFN